MISKVVSNEVFPKSFYTQRFQLYQFILRGLYERYPGTLLPVTPEGAAPEGTRRALLAPNSIYYECAP